MTDCSSQVHDLHPPGDRAALRGQVAELLIQATDPAAASRALFDLIAAELKLNAFLLYRRGNAGQLELIAHGGLSEAEAAIVATQDLPSCGSGKEAPIPLTGHITGVQEREDGGTLLRRLGLKAWFGQPLIAGERLLGVIGLGQRWADRFHEEDLAFLESVAHYFALALERLRGEAALRESEERLQLAQELGGVASFDWNHTTHETWVSESYREIYGLAPGAYVDGSVVASIIHPDDRKRVNDHFHDARDDGASRSIEYRIIRPRDHKLRLICCTSGVFHDPATNALRVAGIAIDITERKRNEERERLLSREVDHRAKNLLSVVQAMVQLTHANSIPEFVDRVKGRIHALGRVHGLLAASRWDGAELSKLVAEELAPIADSPDRARLIGPTIGLKPAAAQSMALVIHELTTNAVKHGALSVPDGRVDVAWESGSDGKLVLRWRERGGPVVAPPRHFGFGLTHIPGNVERQLGGTLDLHWHVDGLECVVSLPPRQLVQALD